MGKTYAPLTVELIEEGNFVEHVNEELTKVSNALLSHVAKFGVAGTKGAKAKLVVTITLEHEGTSDGDYEIETKFKAETPARPKQTTRAVHEADEKTGEELLMVRASGSDESSPRQLKLATLDGRAVDPDTHKARPRAGT